MKAKAWMKDGKIVIQTEVHQYQVTASLADLMAIRAGGSAEVELDIIPIKGK